MFNKYFIEVSNMTTHTLYSWNIKNLWHVGEFILHAHNNTQQTFIEIKKKAISLYTNSKIYCLKFYGMWVPHITNINKYFPLFFFSFLLFIFFFVKEKVNACFNIIIFHQNLLSSLYWNLYELHIINMNM